MEHKVNSGWCTELKRRACHGTTHRLETYESIHEQPESYVSSDCPFAVDSIKGHSVWEVYYKVILGRSRSP